MLCLSQNYRIYYAEIEGSKHLLEIVSLVKKYYETEKGPHLREPDL